jgi:hypothetical protein
LHALLTCYCWLQQQKPALQHSQRQMWRLLRHQQQQSRRRRRGQQGMQAAALLMPILPRFHMVHRG